MSKNKLLIQNRQAALYDTLVNTAGNIKVEQLAQKFNVHRKTIERDLKVLEAQASRPSLGKVMLKTSLLLQGIEKSFLQTIVNPESEQVKISALRGLGELVFRRLEFLHKFRFINLEREEAPENNLHELIEKNRQMWGSAQTDNASLPLEAIPSILEIQNNSEENIIIENNLPAQEERLW